jgi:predicted DNA binding protein
MKAAELRFSPEGGAFPGVDAALASLSGVAREELLNLEWLTDGTYAMLYRLSASDGAAIRATLADHAEVHQYDVVAAGDSYYAFVQASERETLSELLAIAEDNALLLDLPVTFTADGVTVTVAGSAADLQAAFADVTEKMAVSVEWTGSYEPGDDGVLRRLTDRQRDAISAAHDLGFYETPRAASYEEIADELDCAPTTANELLRRAEAAIVDALLEP